jgi:hypothetical protein
MSWSREAIGMVVQVSLCLGVVDVDCDVDRGASRARDGRCRSIGLATAFGFRAALWPVATSACAPACGLRCQLNVRLFWAANSARKGRR